MKHGVLILKWEPLEGDYAVVHEYVYLDDIAQAHANGKSVVHTFEYVGGVEPYIYDAVLVEQDVHFSSDGKLLEFSLDYHRDKHEEKGYLKTVEWGRACFVLKDDKYQCHWKKYDGSPGYLATDGTPVKCRFFSLSRADRERRQGEIWVRNGRFRDAVLPLWDSRCAITGENLPEVLEAAHLLEVGSANDDQPHNGIILRCDLHKLFDQRWIWVDMQTRRFVHRKGMLSDRYEKLLSEGDPISEECFQRIKPFLEMRMEKDREKYGAD